MKTDPCREALVKNTETPALDPEGEFPTRRPVTINEHALFLDSLLTPQDLDDLDDLVAELRETQPEGFDQ
jgi:hypothetical protein